MGPSKITTSSATARVGSALSARIPHMKRQHAAHPRMMILVSLLSKSNGLYSAVPPVGSRRKQLKRPSRKVSNMSLRILPWPSRNKPGRWVNGQSKRVYTKGAARTSGISSVLCPNHTPLLPTIFHLRIPSSSWPGEYSIIYTKNKQLFHRAVRTDP